MGFASFRIALSTCVLLVLYGQSSWGSPPDWAKQNTQVRKGNLYRVVCTGEAPSIDLARREALQSCRNSATSQLMTEANIKRVTIETERAVAYHQEVSEDLNYKGLDCVPEQEQIDDHQSSVQVWMKCLFDLNKATVTPRKSKQGKPLRCSSF